MRTSDDLTTAAVQWLSSTKDQVLDYLIGPDYFDERTQGWPLTSGRAAVLVVALYMIAVPVARWVMMDRKPFDMRRFSTFHNAAMALLSLWMVVETLTSQYECAGWDKKLMIWGTMTQPGKTFTPACYRLARVLYVHYISKVVEFTDTLIMILKRNDHQISFLHVYHHASTFLCWWCAINFCPGGDAYFICAVNSFVHVVMYSYYLIAAAKVVRIPVAVKKGITVMQMVQFGFLLAQALFGMFIASYYRPKIVVVLALAQAAIFMTLFGNFFLKTYVMKSRKVRPAVVEAKKGPALNTLNLTATSRRMDMK